jgi:hypothetical protein
MIIDNNAEFWIGLNDGSFVSIHDAREVAETGNKDGTNYKIDYRRLFTPAEGSGEWLFFRLVSEAHPDEPVWLFVRLLDGDVDTRVYVDYSEDQFRQGDRNDIMEWGQEWIFEAPDDPDNFRPRDLKFAEEISFPTDGEPLVYTQKFSFHGQVVESTGTVLDEETFTTLAEYSTDQDTMEPELLIMEMGNHEAGGLIILLAGNSISEEDLTVMPIETPEEEEAERQAEEAEQEAEEEAKERALGKKILVISAIVFVVLAITLFLLGVSIGGAVFVVLAIICGFALVLSGGSDDDEEYRQADAY